MARTHCARHTSAAPVPAPSLRPGVDVNTELAGSDEPLEYTPRQLGKLPSISLGYPATRGDGMVQWYRKIEMELKKTNRVVMAWWE